MSAAPVPIPEEALARAQARLAEIEADHQTALAAAGQLRRREDGPRLVGRPPHPAVQAAVETWVAEIEAGRDRESATRRAVETIRTTAAGLAEAERLQDTFTRRLARAGVSGATGDRPETTEAMRRVALALLRVIDAACAGRSIATAVDDPLDTPPVVSDERLLLARRIALAELRIAATAAANLELTAMDNEVTELTAEIMNTDMLPKINVDEIMATAAPALDQARREALDQFGVEPETLRQALERHGLRLPSVPVLERIDLRPSRREQLTDTARTQIYPEAIARRQVALANARGDGARQIARWVAGYEQVEREQHGAGKRRRRQDRVQAAQAAQVRRGGAR